MILIAAVIIALRMSPAGELLSFENLKREQTELLLWVNRHAVLSVAAFICCISR